MGPLSSKHLFGACVPGSVLGSGVASGELDMELQELS